ncbi:WASH complex subunit 3 isoform X5 [Falco peregrinus]|uniref:WASH complex subunit 3 isoform X5 n=1 Tax=Falco peregrinus TaxID=8954 RepID=UPI00247AC749|nr:WASH complex subunit 3 isoform X5 [Falco peregrinus]
MDEDGLPIVGSGIDLTKVPAIQQKRTVAFLNQFVVHTVQFLNRFSTVCEEKLSALSLRIQQIETTLNILDAKNNIHEEGLQKTEVVTENVRTVAKDPQYARYLKMVQVNLHAQVLIVILAVKLHKENTVRQLAQLSLCQGVPVMAIRNKMISEGLNPDLLETPDAPVPAWGDDGKAEDSSDSESSFSD